MAEMTMARVVCEVDSDVKKWLQHHALDTGSTMSEIVAALILDYKAKEESPAIVPTTQKAKK